MNRRMLMRYGRLTSIRNVLQNSTTALKPNNSICHAAFAKVYPHMNEVYSRMVHTIAARNRFIEHANGTAIKNRKHENAK